MTGTASSAAELPINNLGIELFDAVDKKWLAVICRFLGYAWLSLLNKTTAAAVIETLDNIFSEYGYPSVISSYGGPQFRSGFNTFCKEETLRANASLYVFFVPQEHQPNKQFHSAEFLTLDHSLGI